MKIGFIFVLYHTPVSEQARLRKEIQELHLPGSRIYFIDNTTTGEGYAAGVNKGIQQASVDKCSVYIIANPDISFFSHEAIPLNRVALEEGLKQFDLLGFRMIQNGQIYYGGTIDRLRMSGGLNSTAPVARFMDCDFVSGSLIVIKREIVEKVGLWDTLYGMYYEEVDYCIRARQAGYSIGIDTSITYEHFEVSGTNEKKEYYLARNRLKVLVKYGSAESKAYELVRIPITFIEEFPLIMRIVRKRSFLVNFASLSVSSFLNKILTFLLFIVLVGVLSPAQYGVYTLVWAHLTLLGPFLDLGTTSYGILYSPAQPIAQIAPVLSLRLVLSLLVYVATAFLAYIFRYDPQVISYILLTGSAIFFNALSGSYLIFHSIKQSSYKPALVSLAFNAILVITLIIIVFSQRSLLSLFMATGLLYGGFSVILAYMLYRSLPFFSLQSFDLKKWMPIISKSFIFVLIGVCASLYYKIDIFLLNSMRGEAELGVYSSGYKFFDAFMFLAASYNIAASPRFVKAYRGDKKQFAALIWKDVKYLALLGGLISIGIVVGAPFFLSFLKRDYTAAIPILQIVICALPFILMASVFYNALYVLNKAHLVLAIFAVQAVINGVLNYFFIPQYGAFASASITVLSEMINYIGALGAIIYLLRNTYENIS